MLEDFHFQRILARDQVGGQIELRRQAAVLRIADLLAVHPHVQGGRNAAEMDDRAAAGPVRRQRECAGVEPDRRAVVVAREGLRRFRRGVALDVAGDRIARIRVVRRIVRPLQLPTARNRYRRLLLPDCHVRGVLPLEIPRPVERNQPLGRRAGLFAARNLQRQFGAVARNGHRARRQTVPLEYARIPPRLRFPRPGGECAHAQNAGQTS